MSANDPKRIFLVVPTNTPLERALRVSHMVKFPNIPFHIEHSSHHTSQLKRWAAFTESKVQLI